MAKRLPESAVLGTVRLLKLFSNFNNVTFKKVEKCPKIILLANMHLFKKHKNTSKDLYVKMAIYFL
jgi:hypothetical protein